MGKEELEALIRVLQEQLARPKGNLVLGTWHIHFDRRRRAFLFDKCESEGYCEERPVVIGVDGSIVDAGGPLFD
jgi:hypothetical protein